MLPGTDPITPGNVLFALGGNAVSLFRTHKFLSATIAQQPLVRKDLPDIVRELSSLEGVRNVGVTTNGINLKRKLPALREAGLTHINVSVSCSARCFACVDET